MKTNKSLLLKLFKADVTKLNTLPISYLDIIITSPPYNVGMNYANNLSDSNTYKEYLLFTNQYLKNFYIWSKPRARLCLNVPLDKNKFGNQSVYADIVKIAKKVGWKYKTTIIWNEQNISKRTAWGSWLSSTAPSVISPVETIIIFYKDEWKKILSSKKLQTNISKEEFITWTNGLWTFPGENPKKVNHPAPFPLELPKRLIKLFSFKYDVVCDPFCGSGTTLIEAIKNKRYAIGFDISEKYIEISKNRIDNEVNIPYAFNMFFSSPILNQFKSFFSDKFLNETFSPSEFINENFKNFLNSTNTIRGRAFEFLFAFLLYKLQIYPFYYQATNPLIANAVFDFLIFDISKKELITFSLKTSLRERWKQAELEGQMLKAIFKNKSINYLLTFNHQEFKNLRNKLDKNELLGIDKIILVPSQDFDFLLKELSSRSFSLYSEANNFSGKIFN